MTLREMAEALMRGTVRELQRDEIQLIEVDGTATIRVHTYRALVRVAGYFRYQLGPGVLFRGQEAAYGNLRPGLYRAGAKEDALAELEAFLTGIRDGGIIDDVPGTRARETTEPLLQHYGFRTRWLDIVDSLPHALFFATHQRVSCGNNLITYRQSEKPSGYLYMINTGTWQVRAENGVQMPGLWNTSKDMHVCDLRSAKPSTALRPHAQHGLLVRRTDQGDDLWPAAVAQVQIDVQAARTWIGGSAFSREAFFPNADWDHVYAKLVGKDAARWYKANPWKKVDLGAIDLLDFCGFDDSDRMGPHRGFA